MKVIGIIYFDKKCIFCGYLQQKKPIYLRFALLSAAFPLGVVFFGVGEDALEALGGGALVVDKEDCLTASALGVKDSSWREHELYAASLKKIKITDERRTT